MLIVQLEGTSQKINTHAAFVCDVETSTQPERNDGQLRKWDGLTYHDAAVKVFGIERDDSSRVYGPFRGRKAGVRPYDTWKSQPFGHVGLLVDNNIFLQGCIASQESHSPVSW